MTISPLNDKHLEVRADLAGPNYQLLNAMPGFKKWDGRVLRVRIVGANIAYLMRHWPDAEWVGGANDHKVKFLSLVGANEAAVAAKDTGAILPDDSGYAYKRAPMDHQRRAFLISRDKVAYAYLMEQGTGKTKVVIDVASYLYSNDKIDCLIIIAWPNGVHRMWVDEELPKDCSVPYAAEFWSANLTAKKAHKIQRVLECKRNGKLSVMTYNVEAFASSKARISIKDFLKRHRCMVVIDQSASIKNPEAQRTKFLLEEVARHPNAIYRRIMDGDPVAEGAEELYSQFYFLDPWIIGHDTFTGFKSEYCIIGQWREVQGYRNLEGLHKLVDPHCFRVLADECLDLPDRIYKRWDFELSKEERRVFDELKKKSLAFFEPRPEDEEALEELPENGVIEEKLAIVKNMRLQQISSGWWPDPLDFKPLNGDKKSSRLDALETLLGSLQGKCLIFARFRADLEAIQKLLGKKAVSYHGGIGENARAIAKKRFMEDDSITYFIGQPRNAGIGHTLTAASHVIFYANDPSLRLRAESEKRAHRQGLKHTLHVWDLCARNTQDKKITTSLLKKRRIAAEVLQDPIGFFLDYEED